jgi:large subunit ribosomal protein L10
MKVKKIDKDKINFLATLPSLDQIRAKLLGLLNAPAHKIASIAQAPGGQLARLINARSEQLEKSNQV